MRALFLSAAAMLLVSAGWAAAAKAANIPDVELKLFAKTEVDRSNGCTVALWQSDRDPDKDRFAYVFIEKLYADHARAPAHIKVGGNPVLLQRVATGGRTTGYDLYEYQLYKMPGRNQYVVLELKLADEEGEAIEIEQGTMSVVMRGKQVFRASVKGNAGCMTPAAPAPPPDAAGRRGATPAMFRRYKVTQAMIPRAFTQAVEAKYHCDPAYMKTAGVTGFQMSEESAIWQVPCQLFAYQSTSVFALVYLTDPAQNLEFLTFQGPDGKSRSSGPGELMGAVWDDKTRTVTGVSLGRAHGDCGVLERHRVGEDGHFRLIEYREKVTCDGKRTPPEAFPLVYRAR